MVSKQDVVSALKNLGVTEGDSVLFHSSLKCFGEVDGGADTVIDAFLDAVGVNGTVIVPTLSMKNFSDAYKTWYPDKPSDAGLITEVFRLRKEAKRSDQQTHSVAAIGKKAAFYTETHGKSGKRYGIYGDTPFSKDSPWQKMFEDDVKVVLVGVDFDKLTFRHLFEYTLVDEALEKAMQRGVYQAATGSICNFEERGRRCETYFWPYLSNRLTDFAQPYTKEVVCGNALLKAVNIKPFGEALLNDVRKHPENWYEGNILKWFKQNQA